MDERGVVAASTQRAQTAGKKGAGWRAPGRPAALGPHLRSPVSPGDRAVHRAAAVEVPFPVVVDAETAGAWGTDLAQKGI